ncbi:hypothetical protein BBJ28_00016679, partial [Nothophytophthora sp. Chile5]
RVNTERNDAMPHFLEETRAIREDLTWQVDPQPAALQDRRVDIGDVSPANREFLLRALNSGAQVEILVCDRAPCGSIKATVLIENIFAAFEMDEILFELRHHSSGLNCGMWDYTASIVVNFRHRSDFVLPDRQQYVSMKSDFLKYYMELLIRTCKRRSAPATTGMVPFVLSELPAGLSQAEAIAKAQAGKRMEALAGSDGALVYDLALVKPVQEVFTSAGSSASLAVPAIDETFYKENLLTVPRGNVTRRSVEANVRVALLYVLHWLYGQGTVVVNGCVEDSATAEISRAQLWQWVHHQVPIAASFERVNAEYVNLCCCPRRGGLLWSKLILS